MKKNTLLTSSLIGLGALLPLTAQAQRTWIDDINSADASWSNPSNWTGGLVPATDGTSAVVIANTSNTNFITVDTGLPTNTIASLTFNSGIAAVEFAPAGVETLTVSGAINNQSSIRPKFSTAVSTLGSATWSGALEFANTVNIDANSITVAGDVLFGAGNINFSITSLSTYGRFLGSGVTTFNGGNINITSNLAAATFTEGSTFDFTTGSFTGATLNVGSLPTLGANLAWNTSQFLSQGILTVVNTAVPEPSTWAALAGMTVLGVAASRRRRSA